MDPALEGFLREAVQVAQKYDVEGNAVLPLRAFHTILDDLKLQDDSDGAYYLMDHLQVSQEHGLFSYHPLLEMLGLPLPGEFADSPGQEEPGYDGGDATPAPADSYDQTVLSGPGPEAARYEDPSAAEPAWRGESPARDSEWGDARGAQGAASPSANSFASPSQVVPPESAVLATEPSTLLGPSGHFESALEQEASSPLEVGGPVAPDVSEARMLRRAMEAEVSEEDFWARQAPGIQRMFTAWDANQISNEAFAARLQAHLGDRVDIADPDSEFLRVTNKHRSARNMKFAMLMSALRRDAHDTRVRLLGELAETPPPAHAGSAASSRPAVMDPMERRNTVSQASSPTPSSGPQHAAGKSTGAVAPPSALQGGRRHYPYGTDVADFGGGAPAPAPQRCQPTTAPYAYAFDEAPPFRGAPRSRAPYAYVNETTPPGRSPPQRPRPAWEPAPASAPSAEEAAGSTLELDSSQDAPSALRSSQPLREDDAVRVAESTLSEFTQRDRRGHGNILTWGNDSRAVTPTRQRQGRAPGYGDRQSRPSPIC